MLIIVLTAAAFPEVQKISRKAKMAEGMGASKPVLEAKVRDSWTAYHP